VIIWKRLEPLWVVGAALFFSLAACYAFDLSDGISWLHLLWWTAGLTWFYALGSSQSRNESERMELKLDWLMHKHGLNGLQASQAFDRKYARKYGPELWG
jgi:hypothetical protein